MEIGISTAVLLGIVVGLSQVVRQLGINKKFIPIFAVVFGLAFSLMGYFVANIELVNAIIGGIVIGLSAVGLYSGVKNVKEGIEGK